MKECKKHQQNLDALYNCYCMETDTFILGEDKMKVTARDISLLFGLPLKGINIEPTKKLTSRTIPPDCKEFATRNFGTNTYITRNVLERRIKQEISKRKKENEEDLPLLIIMQILLTFFFPINQQKLRWGILPYLIDSETMQTVSWPQTIEENFSKFVKKFISKSRNMSGCSMLPLYCICEEMNLIQPRKQLAEDLPRFAQWDVRKLKDIVVKQLLNDIKVGNVS